MIQSILQFLLSVITESWLLAVEMAPYLFLGFAVAGALHVFLPFNLVSKYLGGESSSAVLKASLLGVPLPLCSCSVLPVATSLRKAGAGRSPTLSFLITTPVTGVDSLMATWGLLGGVFTIVRLLVSTILGIVTGFIMSLVSREKAKNENDNSSEKNISCAIEQPIIGFKAKFKTAIYYAFIELPTHISGSILVGLLIGGIITAAVPHEIIQEYLGVGIIGILISVAFAVPLYVCATGSIPIAAAMMLKGFSPGAALAFLIAGPATNAIAITTVKKILGTKALYVYLSSIFFGSIAFGLIFDLLLPAGFVASVGLSPHAGMHDFSMFSILTGAALIILLSILYMKDKQFVQRLFSRKLGATEMKNLLIFSVPDMTCQHCKATIEKALESVEGIKSVFVDINNKIVSIELSEDVTPSMIISTLDSAGYAAMLQQ